MAAPDDFSENDLIGAEPEHRAAFRKLWLRMLTGHLWLIAALFGVVLFVGSVVFDSVILEHEVVLVIALSSAAVALLGGGLVYSLLAYGRQQRRRVLERVEALNEVNHHIRNALQSLAFAAGSLRDRKEGDAISEAITRIQWTLLEILPKVEPGYEPFQGSVRDAVERLRRPPPQPDDTVK